MRQEQLGALDHLTHSKTRSNNHIELLPSGVQSYKKRWALLAKAKHSIHIATFSMMNDETTHRLRDVLIEKLNQGVEVRIFLDEIVNRTTFANKTIRALETHGAIVHQYNPLLEEWQPIKGRSNPIAHVIRIAKLKLKRHYHEKYMIIDGTECILGGINWGDKYAYGGERPKAWRDSDVYLKGAVVNDIQTQFLSDFHRYQLWKDRTPDQASLYHEFVSSTRWVDKDFIAKQYCEYLPTPEKAGSTPIRYVAHKPYDNDELTLSNAFISLIKGAEKSIYWGCHGIRPPRILGHHLAEAAQRGVKVHLITNSQHAARTLMVNGLLGWMYWECTKHYRWLLERGIEIYEWQKPGAFHSKNFLVDDQVASVGSFNIARGSTYHHSESNIFVDDTNFAVQMKQQFEIDLQDCKQVKLGEIKLPKEDAFQRPLHERDLMIHEDFIPDDMKQELAKGTYKRILT